jgi:predicted amidohydrolase YtcJ
MRSADLVLANGKFLTLNSARAQTTAIAFANHRVVAYDDEAVALQGAQTQVIDLRGRLAIPGLVDHHIHFTAYAMSRARVNLDGARSLEEAVARVAERVKSSKPGEWVVGLGWNDTEWAVPRFPTKAALDPISPENPVALDRKDGHSVWVNSAALRLAGINSETPDPAGGVIDRDAAGHPSGTLRENAVELLGGNIGFEAGKISPDVLLSAIQTAHTLGLTGIHNVEGPDSLSAFQELHAQNKLTLRVTHMIPCEKLEHALALGIRGGLGDDWLSIGGIKIFADGSLGSQTAWMLEPFEGQPANRGVATHSPEQIGQWARAAAGAGMMVCTHAIGDRAIRQVLDLYEKLRDDGFRVPLRIEHVQHLHPADIPRFHALDVTASMQPIHATSDYKMTDQYLGARGRYTYAFKSLLDAGATVVFGSDCPVETLDPWVGIHAAVTRERANGEPRGGWYPEERLSVEQAVRAYLPMPRPDRIEGDDSALTDWIVLSQNIFAIPPNELLSTQVDYTIVGGKVVHAAPG